MFIAFIPASTFVLLLYLVPPSRVLRLPRSSNEQILWRFFAVAISMILAPLPLLVLKESTHFTKHISIFDLTGLSLQCNTFSSLVWPIFVTITLFLGPIIASGVEIFLDTYEEVEKKEKSTDLVYRLAINIYIHLTRSFNETTFLILIRSLIVAPFSEEWAFRACTIPIIVIFCGLTNSFVVFVTCLAFALAHVHHYLDHIRNGMSQAQASREVLSQLSYTSVFGALEAILFLQTGSYLGIVLPHIFCNYIGVPSMYWIQDSNTLRKFFIASFYLVGIFTSIYLLFIGSKIINLTTSQKCLLSNIKIQNV